jgi:mannose-6-phosphate isomerase-like protein (cupin superfamily)
MSLLRQGIFRDFLDGNPGAVKRGIAVPKSLLIVVASWLAVGAAAAAQPDAAASPAGPANAASAQEARTFISQADIADRIARTEAALKSGQKGPSGQMLQSGPWQVGMVYRTTPQEASDLHEVEAELFVVLEGSGAITMGGRLINPTRRGISLSSTTFEGGTEYKLAKGDMLLVPENTPHRISGVDGDKVVFMTVHLARPPPQK